MRRLICVFALMALVTPIWAQNSEETAVRAIIDQMFTGMRTGKGKLVEDAFSTNAVLQTIVSRPDGSVEVKTESVSDFVAAVDKPHAEQWDERIQYGSIQIDHQLATVWTPYQFYLGGKFSHCGVNSFQLVKINGNWKIQYIIDTRRKEACPGNF